MTISEAELQAAVIDAAHLFGWKVAHFRPALTQSGKWATAMQGDKGWPDLVMARDGHIIIAELKSDSGRLTADQDAWLAELNPYGGESGRFLDEYGGRVAVEVWRPQEWRDGTIVETLR